MGQTPDKEDKGWESEERLTLNVCKMLVFIKTSAFLLAQNNLAEEHVYVGLVSCHFSKDIRQTLHEYKQDNPVD